MSPSTKQTIIATCIAPWAALPMTTIFLMVFFELNLLSSIFSSFGCVLISYIGMFCIGLPLHYLTHKTNNKTFLQCAGFIAPAVILLALPIIDGDLNELLDIRTLFFALFLGICGFCVALAFTFTLYKER